MVRRPPCDQQVRLIECERRRAFTEGILRSTRPIDAEKGRQRARVRASRTESAPWPPTPRGRTAMDPARKCAADDSPARAGRASGCPSPPADGRGPEFHDGCGEAAAHRRRGCSTSPPFGRCGDSVVSHRVHLRRINRRSADRSTICNSASPCAPVRTTMPSLSSRQVAALLRRCDRRGRRVE